MTLVRLPKVMTLVRLAVDRVGGIRREPVNIMNLVWSVMNRLRTVVSQIGRLRTIPGNKDMLLSSFSANANEGQSTDD